MDGLGKVDSMRKVGLKNISRVIKSSWDRSKQVAVLRMKRIWGKMVEEGTKLEVKKMRGRE